MKKLFLITLATVIVLFGCGGGGGSAGDRPGSPSGSAELFTTIPEGLQLMVNSTQRFEIKGGTGLYTAEPADRRFVSAQIDRSSAGVTKLILNGLLAGTTTLDIRDSTGAKVTAVVDVVAPVVVPLATTAPSILTLLEGQVPSRYSVTGGAAPYSSVSSNESVLKTSISGGVLSISPIGKGVATVSISDNDLSTIRISVNIERVDAPLTITAPSSLTLVHGQRSDSFQIRGGAAPYGPIVSSNSNLVVGQINNSTNPPSFVVDATSNTFGSGTATVSIYDKSNAKVEMPVTVGSLAVKNLSVDLLDGLTLSPGQSSPDFTVSGGTGVYSVNSNNAGTVKVVYGGASVFSLLGIESGAAGINIVDSNSGVVLTRQVSVVNPSLFTSSPSSVTLLPGTSMAFSVGGGVPDYTVVSNKPSVVSVSKTGQGQYLMNASSNEGVVGLTLTDKVGTQLTLQVNVSRSASAPLKVSPEAITGRVGETVTILVADGVAPYRVVSSNPSVVSATIIGNSASIQLKDVTTASSVILNFTDAIGQVKAVNVSSLQGVTEVRLSPAALTISELDTRELLLSVYGGVGPYTAYSSSSGLAPVSVSGNQVVVGGGPRCFRPDEWVPENYAPSVTVTVVDKTGASAVSEITIHNDYGGAVCP